MSLLLDAFNALLSVTKTLSSKPRHKITATKVHKASVLGVVPASRNGTPIPLSQHFVLLQFENNLADCIYFYQNSSQILHTTSYMFSASSTLVGRVEYGFTVRSPHLNRRVDVRCKYLQRYIGLGQHLVISMSEPTSVCLCQKNLIQSSRIYLSWLNFITS